jgi:hypothetical protein
VRPVLIQAYEDRRPLRGSIDPAEALLSLVHERYGTLCRIPRPDGGTYPDSLLDLKRYRTSNGCEVAEFSLSLLEPWEAIDDDDLPDAAPLPEGSVIDTIAGVRRYPFGPQFMTMLAWPGHRVVVRVVSECGQSPAKETLAAARAVVGSLRPR